MRTTIDKAGRLVLPKTLRQRLGIRAGDALDITESATGLSLSVVRDRPRLVKDGHVLVFTGELERAVAGDPVAEQREARLAELMRQAVA